MAAIIVAASTQGQEGEDRGVSGLSELNGEDQRVDSAVLGVGVGATELAEERAAEKEAITT